MTNDSKGRCDRRNKKGKEKSKVKRKIEKIILCSMLWASDILCYIQEMLFTGIPVCMFVNVKGLSITATQPVQLCSNIIRVHRALSNLKLIDLLCSIKYYQ